MYYGHLFMLVDVRFSLKPVSQGFNTDSLVHQTTGVLTLVLQSYSQELQCSYSTEENMLRFSAH